MKLFTKEHFTVMPWKNGGGMTTELIRQGLSQAEFNFRLSVAQVDSDGPFSNFPSIDRTLLVLNGSGCRLLFTHKEVVLKQSSAPFKFTGEETISCQLLEGPILDFNVMIKRDWGEAIVTRNHPLEEVTCTEQQLYIYYPKREQLVELSLHESIKIADLENICVLIKKRPGLPGL